MLLELLLVEECLLLWEVLLDDCKIDVLVEMWSDFCEVLILVIEDD